MKNEEQGIKNETDLVPHSLWPVLHSAFASDAMSRISIAVPHETVPIDRGRMREVVRAVLAGEGVADAEISLAFVDDPTIHRLNQRYLQHDEPTDVLSFPLSEPNAKRLSGELVIGAEMARDQAAARGHDVQAELALYVIHGLLHLCGCDDHDKAGAATMRERERRYLHQLGLPDVAPRPDNE
jgi:probable rRNA maturation factor